MNTSEYLEKGDYYFGINDYDNAFKYYHMAHMAKDIKGTFMLAECFRIAFFQANKSKLFCTNNVKYAMDASDLYLTVYRFTNRKDVLAKQLYMDYHIYLSYGGHIVQNSFINDLKKETWLNDPYSKFLKALIQENSNAELLSISHNDNIDVEMRILACFAVCRNLIFHQSSKEAISIVEKKLKLALAENSQAQDTYSYIIALMKEANALGAKLNLSVTISELKNLFSYYDEQDREVEEYSKHNNTENTNDKASAYDCDEYDYSKGYHDPDDYVTRHYDYDGYGNEDDEPSEMDDWIMHEWEIDNIDDGR